MEIQKTIDKILEYRVSGKAGNGINVYERISVEDIKKVIDATVSACVHEFENVMNIASDEQNTLSLINDKIDELKLEYGPKKSKNKKFTK